MAMESTKIIVKVGNTSKIKFSHSKVYRAIIAENLETLSKLHDDCHIVVIESIDSGEEEAVKNFVNNFKAKDKDNNVLFFIPDENDMITSGVADELDYNIYMTLQDLYKAIYDVYNVNVSTFLDDKKKYNSLIQESIPDGITDIFGGIDETNADIAKAIEDVDNSIDKVVDNVDNVDNGTEEVIEQEPEIEEAVDIETETVENNKEDNSVKADESNDTFNNTENKESLQIDLDTTSQLKMELKDAKYDYSVLLKDMKKANARIDELEELTNTLKDERDTVINRFNDILETNEVLENPISLDQYEELNETIKHNDEQIHLLEDAIATYKETIEENNIAIAEKEKQLDDIQNELTEIKNSIDSGEIYKDVVEEYTEKVNGLIAEKESLVDKIDSGMESINNLTAELKQTSESLDAERSYREEVLETLGLTFTKLDNVSKELKDRSQEVDRLLKEKTDLETEISNTKEIVTKQEEQLKTLNEQASTFAEREELSSNYADQQINALKTSNSELATKLSMAEEQLKQKEEQYSQLVRQSGLNTDGANALVETNRTLEQVNKTLREKLSVTARELDTAKNQRTELSSSLNTYKAQCKQLNDTLKAISSVGGAAGVSRMPSGNIKPIQYNGSAKIIPVFGSGSFGITTTAMSLAYKLCTTSKVLYIDFDLVAPKADAWFSKNPSCNNVRGLNLPDVKMTGLGIFYEAGLTSFATHLNSIINSCDRTKGGGIDYLSGVYYRVDALKMATADYSSLFNLLGSRYAYIIVDLGRLGNSEINDQIIKAISNIAEKSVVVTTRDRFEVRNFKMKLEANKINIENIAWLVNMCEATTLDDKVKQSISPAQFGLMMNDSSIFGNREKFTRNKLNKDKLDLFINSVLFAR